MTLQQFIFSKGKKASIRRHLVLWIGGWLFMLLTYPPHGTFGIVGALEFVGIIRYYETAGIRVFFHLLCQMIFCYPLLYYLVPVILKKKNTPGSLSWYSCSWS